MNKEFQKVDELVDARINNEAKKLVGQFGQNNVLKAVAIFEEFGDSLYGATEGYHSRNKADWEIVKITTVLKQITIPLKRIAGNK